MSPIKKIQAKYQMVHKPTTCELAQEIDEREVLFQGLLQVNRLKIIDVEVWNMDATL